ncbi:MAG: FkbM family methyltransferase [Chloroflexaceae bacterium]|nr:FkbM family methyltransferase [Chloroflexaceae bacterium]
MERLATDFHWREGTIDPAIYRSVVTENEYRVPDRLAAEERVIDIGAHIGSFAWLCWQRGSRQIEAYEVDSENLSYLRRNLAETTVQIQQKAVWRSDRPGEQLYFSGYKPMRPDGPDPAGINTAVGNVFATAGISVETLGLDEIIGDRRVHLLKLDCEGSEYPILLSSQRLSQVQTIVGEYHLLQEVPQAAEISGCDRFSPGSLADYLTARRFQVEFVPHPDRRFSPRNGTFFARNLDW